MSVEGTLIIVKQMYDVACLPRMVETEAGMPHLIDSLKHFCGSPDSRVRFYACKTVSALSKSYSDILRATEWEWLVTIQKTMALGVNEGDVENSQVLNDSLQNLGVYMPTVEEDGRQTAERTPQDSSSSASDEQEYLDDKVDLSAPEYITEERSKHTKINTILFRLNMEDESGDIPDTDCLEIQTALVKISGVVSAFINADFLVLTVRGPLRKDPVFIDEIRLGVMQATSDLVKAVLFDQDKGTPACNVESTNADSEVADASYLDDDERLAARAGVKPSRQPLSMSPPSVFNFFTAAPAMYVNGLNTAVSYAKDMEVIEYDYEEVVRDRNEAKQKDTKRKLSLFRRLFG